MIRKDKRDKIVAQALTEIQFARDYKQGIIYRWWKNEDLYYGRKDTRYWGSSDNSYDRTNENTNSNSESRSNVNIASAKTVSFVETMLSKIDSPLTFKFKKRHLADLKKANLLNALKEQDANNDDWNYKDLLGKVDAIIYGRAIYSYYADSINGYCAHLEYVSPYDFLIDPAGGGWDIDSAMYMGRYNIRKSKTDLEKGKKDGIYIAEQVNLLTKNGSGNDYDQTTQEDTNKSNKYAYIGSPANRTINDTSMWKFWEWYTTYEGERYYILTTESGQCIRCELLSDILKVDEKTGHAPFPFWSWAFLPNATEFWTPSKMDYVREIFMAQGVSINQMLDNAEAINKPQRAIDVSVIENVADLVYRRNGVIRMKPGTNINNAFKILEVNSITTPLNVYDKLENIQQLESGITAGSKGVAEEDKVGIYEGNQANAADRFGVWNKSYSQGYKRFAKLWRYGVEDHLTKKVAVDMLGTDGFEETIFISKNSIKPKYEYSILIESSNAELQADAVDKKNKITFLAGYKGDPSINQKVLFEEGATIAGFDPNKIRELLDTSEFGNAELMSEAERDIEMLLNGKIIEPNDNANPAYLQRIVNYMKDHKEDMNEDQFLLFMDYITRAEPIVVRNIGTSISNAEAQQGMIGVKNADDLTKVDPMAGGESESQLEINNPRGIQNAQL
jgi:hypothetical protein